MISAISRTADRRDISEMRNKIIHHYFRVDLEVVWDVVERDLPPLRRQIDAFSLERHPATTRRAVQRSASLSRTRFVERFTNNAKAVSHRRYGYRAAATFTLSLLHYLGKLPMPETVHRFM